MKLNIFHARHVVRGQEQSRLITTSFLYPKIKENYPDISPFLLARDCVLRTKDCLGTPSFTYDLSRVRGLLEVSHS